MGNQIERARALLPIPPLRHRHINLSQSLLPLSQALPPPPTADGWRNRSCLVKSRFARCETVQPIFFLKRCSRDIISILWRVSLGSASWKSGRVSAKIGRLVSLRGRALCLMARRCLCYPASLLPQHLMHFFKKDLMKWECGIPGKDGTLWAGAVFPLTMTFSEVSHQSLISRLHCFSAT